MMKTAEAIEGMTDAGEFEVLATRVLRLEDEDCRLLEHMGVNAEGKTIANPLDGFCQVPGTDPPRFVMTAFTTAKTDSLHDKWLFDHEVAPRAQKATAADDGDLIKAGRRAASLRKDHPNAKFVVHLCTNRRIDDQLMQEAYKLGDRLGMEIRFLAQSRLRDCLDTTGQGQWLRKLHLGIQAELLSLPLLVSLASKSLALYGGEFIITPPDSFIETASHHALTESIQTRLKAAHVVVGASGSGKSVTCYQVLRDHVAAGGIGLWIPGETAANAASLEDAVETHLRCLLPTLEPGAGSIALSFSSPERPLLLVIDDVNRSGAPSNCVRKMLTWSRPLAQPKGTDDVRRTLLLVMPIWDVFWAPFNSVHRDSPWLGVLPVGQMSEEDAVRCLKATMDAPDVVHSDEDCRRLVEALGYDAILIAMFSALAQRAQIQEALAMASEIMQRFVISAVEEASAAAHLVPAEIDASLQSLAAALIEHRDLYPRWSDEQTPEDYSGGHTDDHYMYAQLLRDIPVSDSWPLLQKYWPRLKFSPLFVQLALYIGSEASLGLASQAIADGPGTADLFRFVSMFFGLRTTGLQDRITTGHLESLAPYFGKVEDMVLSDVAEFCEKHDLRDWSVAHVYPELARREALPQEDSKKPRPTIHDLRRRHFPTDVELMEELEALGPKEQRHGRLWHWCEEFGRRRDDPTHWRSVIGSWLSAKPSMERLKIAADVVLQLGTRLDLEILTRQVITGDPAEVASVIANVRFAVMRRSLQ